jgi:hypothetical protein
MSVFQCDVFQHDVFQNDCGNGAGTGTAGGVASGFAEAWRAHGRDKVKRDKDRREQLALIRASDAYKKLKRKLHMLHEHLSDDPYSQWILDKIEDIDSQIEKMERL